MAIIFKRPESRALRDLVGAKVMMDRQFVLNADECDNTIRMIYTLTNRAIRDLYDEEKITNSLELLSGVVHKMYHNGKLSPKTALGCVRGELEAFAERTAKLTVIKGDNP